MVTGKAYVDGLLYEFNANGMLVSGDTSAINYAAAGASGGSGYVIDTSVSNRGVWNYNPETTKWSYYVTDASGVQQTVKGKWFKSNVSGNDCWYVTDMSGVMLTGFVKWTNSIYYLQEEITEPGKMVQGTTRSINGVEYTFDAEGKLVGDVQALYLKEIVTDLDAMQNAASTTYLQSTQNAGVNSLNQTANAFKIGWMDIAGNKKIYLEEVVDATNGNKYLAPAVGLRQIDGLYYYFDEGGILKTGLTTINGKLYYLTETGVNIGSIHIGYITVNGINYYCDPAKGGEAIRQG